ncbi:MAG: carboxylating nicotinate-nucleotide diphosphorylase [Planctomycetota bacterium]
MPPSKTGDFKQQTWDAPAVADCRRLVRLSLDEDLAGRGDVTTEALVDPSAVGAAQIVPRAAGVAAGMPAIAAAVEEFGGGLEAALHAEDGEPFGPGTALATLSGPVAGILTLERTVLNLLGRLLGVAEQTRRFVDAVQGTRACVYDTRKTTPGWRRLEKYAVACGGGRNHRAGLFDAVLIKDNHLAQAGLSPSEAVRRARGHTRRAPVVVEVEVDTLDQLAHALREQPDIVLLDNMPPATLRRAVGMRDDEAPAVQLEASGGVRLDTIGEIAATGVDRISVGALTHSAVALDVGLDWLDVS